MIDFTDIADRDWPALIWDDGAGKLVFANDAARASWPLLKSIDASQIGFSTREEITQKLEDAAAEASFGRKNVIISGAFPFAPDQALKFRLSHARDQLFLLEAAKAQTDLIAEQNSQRMANRWLSSLMDTLPVPLFILSSVGETLAINDPAEQLLHETKCDDLTDFVESSRFLRDLSESVTDGGTRSVILEKSVGADPIGKSYQLTLDLLDLGDDTEGLIIARLAELASRKSSPQTTSGRRQVWRRAIEQTAAMAFETDSTGAFIYVSPALHQLFQKTDAVYFGASLERDFHPIGLDDPAAISQEKRWGGLIELDEKTVISCIAEPCFDRDGIFRGFEVVCRQEKVIFRDHPARQAAESLSRIIEQELAGDAEPVSDAVGKVSDSGNLLRFPGGRQTETPHVIEAPKRPLTPSADNDVKPDYLGLLEQVDHPVLAVEQDGKIDFANPSATRLFPTHSLKGRSLFDLFTPTDAALIRAASKYTDRLSLRREFESGKQVVLKLDDQTTLPCSMRLIPLTGNGRPGFAVLLEFHQTPQDTLSDIAAALEEERLANNKKTEFLARISHELRTPLNAILGFADILRNEVMGPIDNAQYKEYARDIYDSGEFMLSLVNDLLDLSKAEAGKLEFDLQRLDLKPIIDSCLNMVREQSDRKNIELRMDIARDLGAITADRRSVQQILLNILSNAVKYTPPRGKVLLTAALNKAGRIALRIRDTGTGMSAQDLETALKPFHRLKSRGHSREQGTGLGLPLAKALAEANGASFAIRSQPGKGTLVEIGFNPARAVAE